MTKIFFGERFERSFNKVKDKTTREKILKQIKKISVNPSVGKPMRNLRKDTRELYIKPFRLSYSYSKDEIIILELYHKDSQ